MNNKEVLQIALQQSAYDCNCEPQDFMVVENRFFESVDTNQARRYLQLPHICNMVSYGSNIVVTAQKELLSEIRQYIKNVPNIENCFETPGLYPLNDRLKKFGAEICFMAEYFLPDMEDIFRLEYSCNYELTILKPKDFANLYLSEWENALCAKRKNLDVLAVGAYDKGKLVGLAGCSADCDTMWQIGVDVLPEYRRQRIATVLTNRLAKEILQRGKVPFYCAAWSNIKSVRNAIRSGFRPGWVEMTAKKIEYVQDMIESS